MNYPKEIYVDWEEDPNNEEVRYLLAYEDKDGLAPDVNENKTIAVYKLEKTIDITTRIIEKPNK